MPIKLKHATTWGLSVRCSQYDSRALETLLCSLIPSTKDSALYSASTYFAPFNPTPSIPSKLLTQIISSHKHFIASIMGFTIPEKVDSTKYHSFFHSLRTKMNTSNRPIIHALNVSSPRGVIAIINKGDKEIFRKYITDKEILPYYTEIPLFSNKPR